MLDPSSSAMNTAASQNAWYVVQCRANQNYRARENLENQGFTCFLPELSVERLRAGRRIQREEPLFPGYLFIRLDRAGGWHTVRSTRGVQKLVTFGNQPVPVPDQVVEELQTRTESQHQEQAFAPGDTLRIENGPFKDLEAVFQRFDGQERVIVLMGMLHKQHQLTLSIKDVSGH
ncbi:transcription/translation regulatory transformer protein RfaH [Alcanivorax sp. 24]|uniref:transcription/translation regulatory transformer protein RfaH n=1 Tax=Alcanivorax sp. 24 TaxID=2545266 RepID=UPI001414EE80|nr:transcription/translation regulatory transformer protein RfaH [Alcanivorax sp. 24]